MVSTDYSVFQIEYFRRMLLLPFLDLGVTAIFIIVTRRPEIIPVAFINFTLFASAVITFAWWVFRPVARFQRTSQDKGRAALAIERLPARSAFAAALLVMVFSITASSLGVYTPAHSDLSRFTPIEVGFAVAFYACMYAALYGYFTFFAVNDLCIEMRRELRDQLHFSSGLAQSGQLRPNIRQGGIARRLGVIFLVVGVLPAFLLGIDLTLLAPMRAAQGLTVGNVIALDMLASLYVVFASMYFVSRSLLAPILELFNAQEAVRGGDLRHKAAVLTTDELGAVTARFNVMVDALRERAVMQEVLQRYLSPVVATELIASGGLITSRSVEATVMFTDIEGFTSLSETLTPQETVNLLNAYFSLLTDVIHSEGGMVNNFIGDAVVAVFNVPSGLPDHAYAAVRAAIAIQRRLSVHQFNLGNERLIKLPTRIGINTGPVCAGSIGATDRLGYTIYGDAVNLAARIEALNKRFNTRILVSAATKNLSTIQGCEAQFLSLPRTTVAGRLEPVDIFAIHLLDSDSTSRGQLN